MAKFYWKFGVGAFMLNVLLITITHVFDFIAGKSFPSDLRAALTQSMVMAIGIMIIGKKSLDDEKRG